MEKMGTHGINWISNLTSRPKQFATEEMYKKMRFEKLEKNDSYAKEESYSL